MNPRPRRWLYSNALTGTVPSELAALTLLTVLYVRGGLRRRALPMRLRATGRGGRGLREGFYLMRGFMLINGTCF